MIYCCLCSFADEASIADHVLNEHKMSLAEYCELFPEMPVGSLEGIAETLPAKAVRRSKITHSWWPASTRLVIANSWGMIRDISGKAIRGIVVATDKFRAGYAIQDTDTQQLYSTPTGWVRDRAPWIPSPNGWKFVKPQTELTYAQSYL